MQDADHNQNAASKGAKHIAQSRQTPTADPPATSNYQYLVIKSQKLPRNLMQFHEGEVAYEA